MPNLVQLRNVPVCGRVAVAIWPQGISVVRVAQAFRDVLLLSAEVIRQYNPRVVAGDSLVNNGQTFEDERRNEGVVCELRVDCDVSPSGQIVVLDEVANDRWILMTLFSCWSNVDVETTHWESGHDLVGNVDKVSHVAHWCTETGGQSIV
jgi:hypothetical protein